MKTPELCINKKDLDSAVITRVNSYSVHFKLCGKYYAIKQCDQDGESFFTLFAKPLNGGRGHWIALGHRFGLFPFPAYYGRNMVYAHMDARGFILNLVGKNLIGLLEKGRVMGLDELLKKLTAEDILRLLNVRLLDPCCRTCKAVCPIRWLNLPVKDCSYNLKNSYF